MFKPVEELDFIHGDKCFYQTTNGVQYCQLLYNEYLFRWYLYNYTDKTFTESKMNGDVCDFDELIEVGIDILERCDDYEYDELD